MHIQCFLLLFQLLFQSHIPLLQHLKLLQVLLHLFILLVKCNILSLQFFILFYEMFQTPLHCLLLQFQFLLHLQSLLFVILPQFLHLTIFALLQFLDLRNKNTLLRLIHRPLPKELIHLRSLLSHILVLNH